MLWSKDRYPIKSYYENIENNVKNVKLEYGQRESGDSMNLDFNNPQRYVVYDGWEYICIN